MGSSKDESNIKKTYNFSPFIEVMYALSSLELRKILIFIVWNNAFMNIAYIFTGVLLLRLGG